MRNFYLIGKFSLNGKIFQTLINFKKRNYEEND